MKKANICLGVFFAMLAAAAGWYGARWQVNKNLLRKSKADIVTTKVAIANACAQITFARCDVLELKARELCVEYMASVDHCISLGGITRAPYFDDPQRDTAAIERRIASTKADLAKAVTFLQDRVAR